MSRKSAMSFSLFDQPRKVRWGKKGNRIVNDKAETNHKIMTLGTLSTSRFLSKFGKNLSYLETAGKRQKDKSKERDFGAGAFLRTKESVQIVIEHDSRFWDREPKHASINEEVRKKILQAIDEHEFLDLAADRVIVEIEDEKLGEVIVNEYRKKKSYFTDKLIKGKVPRIRKSDEKFILKFSSFQCEKDVDKSALLGSRNKRNDIQRENLELIREGFKKRALHLDSMINERQLKGYHKKDRLPIVLTSLKKPFLFGAGEELVEMDSFVNLINSSAFHSRWAIVRQIGRHFENFNPYYKYYGTKEDQTADLEGITR